MEEFTIESTQQGQRFYYGASGVLFLKLAFPVKDCQAKSLALIELGVVDKEEKIYNAVALNSSPEKDGIKQGDLISIPDNSILRILDDDLTPEQVEGKI